MFETLKATIKGYMRDTEEHRRSSHYNGACNVGTTVYDWGRYHGHVREHIRLLLEKGLMDERFVSRRFELEAAAEFRAAIDLPTAEERLSIYREAGEEYGAEKKAASRAFAKAKYDELVALGFSSRGASQIMRAAGPGRAIEAVCWARYALYKIKSVDALDCLLAGARGTNGFGRDRMYGVLEAFGLEFPTRLSSNAFFSVMAGAHMAILAGLPEGVPPFVPEVASRNKW